MPEPKIQLDHVIVLLPYSYITNPPEWLTKNFHISPGGRHADNKTENRLIIFSDGTYIELIAFINDDPEKRKGHWWDKPYGIVDYALTTSSKFDYEGLQKRLKDSGSGVSYAQPIEGGRRKPDGVELKWKVTFPEGVGRGEVPFWCHDVTPRDRRVPISEESTKHPSGAVGMACVVAELAGETLKVVEAAMPAITEQERHSELGFAVGTPVDVAKRFGPAVQLKKIEAETDKKLRLRLVVDCGGKNAPSNIGERVDGGEVLLGFI